VFVKWWLPAIPHYLIVAVFLDTGWTVWSADGPWHRALLADFSAASGRSPLCE
jgi:hypothetical protein